MSRKAFCTLSPHRPMSFTIGTMRLNRCERNWIIIGDVSTLAATLWTLSLAVALVAGVLVRGIVALILAQIALAPLRKPRIGLAFRALATYVVPAVGAMSLIVGLVFLPAILSREALLAGARLVSGAARDSAAASELGPGLLTIALAAAAFAFSFWGGDFYIFTSTGSSSVVTRYDPLAKTSTNVASHPSTIVGAGVSTCAPQ